MIKKIINSLKEPEWVINISVLWSFLLFILLTKPLFDFQKKKKKSKGFRKSFQFLNNKIYEKLCYFSNKALNDKQQICTNVYTTHFFKRSHL